MTLSTPSPHRNPSNEIHPKRANQFASSTGFPCSGCKSCGGMQESHQISGVVDLFCQHVHRWFRKDMHQTSPPISLRALESLSSAHCSAQHLIGLRTFSLFLEVFFLPSGIQKKCCTSFRDFPIWFLAGSRYTPSHYSSQPVIDTFNLTDHRSIYHRIHVCMVHMPTKLGYIDGKWQTIYGIYGSYGIYHNNSSYIFHLYVGKAMRSPWSPSYTWIYHNI